MNPTNILEYRSKRAIPVPEPMLGWAIVQLIEVEKAGAILVPSYGTTGMETLPDEARRFLRARVVKTSKQYTPPNCLTPVDVPFGPGDYLLFDTQPQIVTESFPIMLPDGYRNVAIRSVSAYLPCPMEDKRKPAAELDS